MSLSLSAPSADLHEYQLIGRTCETPLPLTRRQAQAPYKLCELKILRRPLLFVHDHSLDRLSQFQSGAHLLNLRGLVFDCCRETRNRAFQVRDPLLLFLEFFEARLGLGALGSAYSHLLPTGIGKGRAQVTIGIDVHGEGGASINGRPEDATDIRVLVRSSAGGDPADGKHVGIAGKTGIADIDIVADDSWFSTRSSAQGGIVIASAILKCRAAHCRVVASVSVGLERERAHSGIVSAVVVIDQSGCSKGAVPCARGIEQKSCGAHCRIGIRIVEYKRSSPNAGVKTAGASSK